MRGASISMLTGASTGTTVPSYGPDAGGQPSSVITAPVPPASGTGPPMTAVLYAPISASRTVTLEAEGADRSPNDALTVRGPPNSSSTSIMRPASSTRLTMNSGCSSPACPRAGSSVTSRWYAVS